MTDRKQYINRQLNAVYLALKNEINNDQADAARIAARAGQYLGFIAGITGAGYQITIRENGQHAIEERARTWKD